MPEFYGPFGGGGREESLDAGGVTDVVDGAVAADEVAEVVLVPEPLGAELTGFEKTDMSTPAALRAGPTSRLVYSGVACIAA